MNRLPGARPHDTRPLFIGASLPLPGVDADRFSLAHAREHQVVDALSRATRDTGAVVLGYTTALAIHVEITCILCHRERLMSLLQSQLRHVGHSPAPNDEAIEDVLRELGTTPERELTSRRLERWMLAGGSLSTDSTEEATVLRQALQGGTPKAYARRLPVCGAQVVVLGGSPSRCKVIRSAVPRQPRHPHPRHWQTSGVHTILELELDVASHVALVAALPTVQAHLHRLEIDFSATFVGRKARLATSLPHSEATKQFLAQSILAGYEACKERTAARILADAQDVVSHGRYLLERLEHGGHFRSLSMADFARHCSDPRTTQTLAGSLRTLAEPGEPLPPVRRQPVRVVQARPPRRTQARVARGALALPGAPDAAFSRGISMAQHDHAGLSISMTAHADHLVCYFQGRSRDIDTALAQVSQDAGRPFAWTRSDDSGRLTAGQSGSWLSTSATSAAPASLAGDHAGIYEVIFEAPGLFEPDYLRHMAVAHALMHRTGLLSESRLFADIRSWLAPGILASHWGFQLVPDRHSGIQDVAALRRAVARLIQLHHENPGRGELTARVRELVPLQGRRQSLIRAAQEALARMHPGRADIRRFAFPPEFRASLNVQ